jgi:hypothetical protein
MIDIYNKKRKMTKFGILKSKIENVLLESYNNGTFKQEIKNFKKLVLENKNISKIFYMYDELNSPKALSESYITEYIHECITIYENTVNKISTSEIKSLNEWVKDSKSNDAYDNIDNLFSRDVLTIESRIKSKKIISENLRKLPITKTESVNIPLKAMVSIANQTINSYIESLNESDKDELIKLLSEDDSKLNEDFNVIKESVVDKLTKMKSTSDDSSVKSRINDTLSKVISEKYDKLTYFKLKSLNETL